MGGKNRGKQEEAEEAEHRVQRRYRVGEVLDGVAERKVDPLEHGAEVEDAAAEGGQREEAGRPVDCDHRVEEGRRDLKVIAKQVSKSVSK